MIDTIEEFPHIALKGVTGKCAVSAYLLKHLRKNLDTFVRAFTGSTRERVWNVRRLKDWIQSGKHGVMQHAVTNIRFVDMAQLRVLDVETRIRTVAILLATQISGKSEDILLKVFLKLEHILFHSLATFELVPRMKERLGRGNLFENMFVRFHA